MNMVNTTYNSTEEMIKKLQRLKGKTKLKLYENINNSYTEMKNENFRTQTDAFSRNAQVISKIYHEVFLLLKILQTKPQIRKMNIIYYDLYYTVLKNRDDNEIVNNNENDYSIFNDFKTPNLYIGIEPRETILKYRSLRS